MVAIPAGRTVDGAATVAQPFLIDRTPVTVADFAACVHDGGCSVPPGGDFCNYEANRESHPMNCVGWDDANGYCSWAGRRLPTAEEWQLAARGTADARRFPWGDEEVTDARAHWGDRVRGGRRAQSKWAGDRRAPARTACSTRRGTSGSGRASRGADAVCSSGAATIRARFG